MLIKNCKIISSTGIQEADILIKHEKIEKIGKNINPKGHTTTLNARGKAVMPGIIDAHTHIRDFKETAKEDYTSASKAALAGGITTLLEMPNTHPPINNTPTLKKRITLGEKKSHTDFGIHLGHNTQTQTKQTIPAPSVKIYMENLNHDIEKNLEKAFQTTPQNLTIHCEDPRIIERNQKHTHETQDFLIHADIREKRAETSAVEMAARLSLEHRKKIHICHATLKKTVETLHKHMTCEVTPHHLLLSEKDLRDLKGFAKTNPPLRSKLDVYNLWQKVKNGKVQVIASDHAPHTLEEKKQDVYTCPSGIPNLDVMLKLMLDVVSRRALTLQDLTRMMCENPAKIFKVPGKGYIKPGSDADLIMLDLKARTKIDTAEFHSKAKYSPFAGRETTGDVKTTILRGKIAFREGEFHVKPGHGKYLYPLPP